MGGEEGKTSFGCDSVMVVAVDVEDEAFRLFEEWLVELEEVETIWSCGWALGQDGPDATTQNQRAEAVDACALSKSVVPSDLGAQELGVAPEGPRKLAKGWQGRCGRGNERVVVHSEF